MKLTGTKCLVTGAGGFIGSHLAEALVEAGAEVRAFTHYHALGSHGWLENSPLADQMEVVAGDLQDRDSMADAVRGVQVVFHLGALIPIPYSYRAPGSFLRTNAEGTLNVVLSARDAGVERLVHTSTSEVYGTALTVPIGEDHPLQAQSPYAASKIAADKVVQSAHLSFGVPAVTVRPFNTYGPRQSARAVIPTIITQLLAREQIRLGSLHPTRDFNYVADTVSGFIAAAQAEGVEGQTFNLGTGREITIGDLAREIADLVGTELNLEEDLARLRPGKSEVDRLLADATAAGEALGWTPDYTLSEGLAETIQWFRGNMSGYCPDVYQI